ncbi:MAG: type IV secretory system conjugative DNA transfer family protein [Pseudonocardiaceae bacterium]
MSLTTKVELIGVVFSLGLAELARHRRTPALMVLWGAIAALATYLVGGWWLVIPAAIAVGWVGWVRWQHRSAQSTVARWNRRNTRHEGMASRWALVWHSSAWAMKRRATVLRPTFASLTRWERWMTTVKAYAIPVCRVGWSIRVWVPIEEVLCVFGRPRRGKTGQLIHWVIDWAGPLLVTSTKVDIYHLTHGMRAKRGPVRCFNPLELGTLPNTIAFDPLTDCADAERADERATDLISGGVGASDGDGKRWDDQAQRVLTGFLHAAALGGHTMTDVLRWVAQPDASERQVMALLRTSPSAYAFVPSAEQFFDTNSRTRTSVTFTIMPALAWLASTRAREATQGAAKLDVHELLAEHSTIYLFAEAKSRLGPLMSALAGYISREAKRIAAQRPGGRLDPGLRLVLDEVANICPVPLPEWTSDFGSHGISIIAAFQSRAQMVSRWGQAGARAIANNTGATILHAYGQDTEDLEHWVTLSGHRDELTPAGVRRVPVLTLAQLRELPRGTVVVFPPETSPTVGRMRPGWRRWDLRRALRAEGVAARAIVEAMEQELIEAADEPVPVPAGDR